jgi:hypothetical protein
VTLFVSKDLDGDDSRRLHRHVIQQVILSQELGALSLDDVSDLPALFELAREYALLPRLCSRVDTRSLSKELRGFIRDIVEDSSARAAARSAEAHLLSMLLSRASVKHVFLKGAGIAAHAVQVLSGDRHTDDVDVVVAPGDRATVLEILETLGYVADLDSHLPAVGGGSLSEQGFTTSDHAEMGLISPRGVRLDLHWFVPDAWVSDLEELLLHTRPAGPEGGQIPVPIPALLLAQICDHVVVHHRARPAYLPRHLADVTDLLAAFGPQLWLAAAPLGSQAALRFTKWLYDATVQERPAVRLIAPSARTRAIWDASAEVFDVIDRAQRDLREDPRRILRKLAPAREFVAASYGIAEDDRRLPLCYVHRLVTLRFLFHPLRG